MNLEAEPVIGIVGGMGPQAGVALFNSILSQTKADADQQHFSTILMSFPGHIVDRTSFLERETAVNPAVAIGEVIRKLETAGANLIGIACNTAHSPGIYNTVLAELREQHSRVKILHMPQETCEYIREHFPQVKRIGIMTTNGTYKAGIYRELLTSQGYDVILPDPWVQRNIIHRMIYDRAFGLKSLASTVSDEVRSLMDRALQFFAEKGAEAIVIGCTDLSVLATGNTLNGMHIIDSTASLAGALIREASRCSLSARPEHYPEIIEKYDKQF